MDKLSGNPEATNSTFPNRRSRGTVRPWRQPAETTLIDGPPQDSSRDFARRLGR